MISVCASMGFTSMAQTVIFDNGPLFNFPGGGVSGADVSHIHDGMNTLGSNASASAGYRMAEDIVIPAGETWNIDSLIFYGYQTNSGTVSTMTDMTVRIWDGIPGDPGSMVIFGDETTNVMITTDWTGIYRTADFISTTCPPATCSSRPIMRCATVTNTSLTAGTYWIDWQFGGTLTSGPWAPPLNFGLGITTTGNAMQYVPANTAWQIVQDTVPANGGNPPYEPQGLPFLVVGSIITGIPSINTNNNISVSPNPVADMATISINIPMDKSATYSFKLYDMLGNTVNHVPQITSTQSEFIRGSLSDGVYFYEFKKDNTVMKIGKLVLQ